MIESPKYIIARGGGVWQELSGGIDVVYLCVCCCHFVTTILACDVAIPTMS